MLLDRLKERSWRTRLEGVLTSPAMQQLEEKLSSRDEVGAVVFPPREQMFSAFNSTPFDDVKVVILGQDPYHGPGQAMGLAFSVPDGVRLPPSLRNIFKEIEADIGAIELKGGDLSAWAEQGVFLLNATLSVEEGKAAAHANYGWSILTDEAIIKLSSEREHLVFMLWGNHAQQKRALIDADKHLVLTAVHPSPLSAYRGFFGCNHFSQANDWLIKKNIAPISW